MKILHFGPDAAVAVNKHDSNFKMSHTHKVGHELFVGCMHIPPGGSVGYHQATITQLFMVASGQGWIRGGQGERIPVRTGDAAFFEADEWHEAGSDTGMMAVVVEYDLGGPIKQFEARGRNWWVYMATGSKREQTACAQLERLLITHDLTKWIFTTHVRIDGLAPIPHSHPVLTLNTRYLDRDDLALSNFLHEQLHWYAGARWKDCRAAMHEFRQIYPQVPAALPEGAGGEFSTYLHLIVNYLEYAALSELLGAEASERIIKFWSRHHYTWIYRTALADTEQVSAVLARQGLII